MKEIMPEEKPEIVEVEHEEFVARALIENARNMARYSIGQTPPPNFASERATDMEVARYLSGVEVDDKNLAQDIKEALDRNLADPDGAFQATSLAVGKAIAAEEVASPKERRFLKRVSDKVTKETGQFIASKSGKKGLAVVSGLSLVATACSGNLGGILARPVDIETPTPVATEVVELPATLIAPAPTEAAENEVVISQRLITQEEVISVVGGEGQEALDAFNASYANFQTELSLEFPNSAFEMWGVQAQTQDGGSIISPFFEVVGENGKSEAVAIVISVGEGDFRYVRLVPLEVQGPDGRVYLTLSQTISAETGQEIPPEPMFWVTYSLEEWNALSNEEQLAALPSFNGLGGILPESQPLEGARMAAIRELTAPTPEAPFDVESLPLGTVFCRPEFCYGGLFTFTSDREIQDEAVQYLLDSLTEAPANRGVLERAGVTTLDGLRANDYVLPTDLAYPARARGDVFVKWRYLESPVRLDRVEMVFLPPDQTGELDDLVEDRGISLMFISTPEGTERVGVSVVLEEDGYYRLRFVYYSSFTNNGPLPSWAEAREDREGTLLTSNRAFYFIGRIMAIVPAEEGYSGGTQNTAIAPIMNEIYSGRFDERLISIFN
jgi:hypothetical protein